MFLLVDGKIRTNNYGSGSKRSKNIRILRIRSRNTGFYAPFRSFQINCGSDEKKGTVGRKK